MSLNGLDDPAVIEAYQSALTEAGGWLLLKYSSRDEVTLLSRGTGGVPDVRVAVEGYEEKSPLYGFLQYRRRKVVLKYVPDGVSRLIQARTTVQFQSILDKFSPQDTTFEFKEATDLTESALSSACLLHAASGSMTSSSSSLRRRRLMEIVEDAEEGGPPVRTELESPLSEDSSKRLSQASDATAVPPPPTPGGEEGPAESPTVADDEAETKSVHSVSRRRFLDQLAQQPFEHRSSTQSMRPSLQELGYSTSSRQKVKLGPRPSVDMNGRPRTAGSMSRNQDQRPVAALPPGVRPRKPPLGPGRPKSQPDAIPVPTLASLKNAPPMPILIPPPSISVPRPKLSPGAKSMNALTSSGMSPEKQRLMRALELRKKQMEKRTKDLQKKDEKRKSATAEVIPADALENKENIDHAQTTKLYPVEEAKPPKIEATKVETVKQVATVTTTVIEEKKPTTADLAKADSAVAMSTVAREDTAEDTVEDNAPEDTTPKYTIPEDTIQQDTAPENNKSEDTASDDTAREDTAPQDAPQQDTAPKDNKLEPTTSEDSAREDAAPEDNKLEDTSSEDTARENPAEENAPEDAAPKENNPSVQTPAELLVTTPQAQDKVVEPHPEQIPEPATQPLIEEEDTTDDSTAPEKFSDRTDDEKATTASTSEPDTALEDMAKPDEEQSIQYEDDDSTPTASEAIHSVASSSLGSQDAIVAGAPEADETAPKEVPTTTDAITNTASQVTLADSTAPLSLPRGDENNHRLSRQKSKRIALLDPILVPTPDLSDEDNLLSDDSFMEELKSATFQEAKPVSVGKGPLSPDGEPRTPLEAWQTRAVSNPGRRPSDLSVMPVVGRSISATFAGGDEQAGPIPVVTAKKVNVSSGISKRIKALEMFSGNRDGVSSPTLAVPPTNGLPSPTATAFEKFRKRASVSMGGSLPPSAAPSARSSFIGPSPDTANPPSLGRKESQSVSVTARIVRNPRTPPTDVNADPIESSVLNLQRSPLIVEHNSLEEADRKSNGVPERRPTLSSRGLSRSSTDTTTARSESRGSSRSRLDDLSSEEKRDSRTSRFIRRMSSLTSPRKNLMSPPGIDRLPPPHTEEETQHAAPKAVDIGEVNVQFPDTLLWKRRFLRIDHQGYLVLTPGNTDAGSRNIVKRYHLSEFQTPCLPDEDRQELPNSILLDFRNGSTLQCACESRKGQAAALQTLVDAHNAHHH
ncbi:uncharacterized protein TRUGW13939_06400 [Talaromyces rugulosus]|uniref:ADF-H domain-containing protein n=1 Tax=Talaromyces rugulosus TaxID=121627 RepID=A0A7H8R001_TALRU|nr:uncharacterized protein TRUGW13939_06400 [Talaromyces rugulosus]QKX59268.1 hypothetical protein TRUGW13939_06400 [Talaromyces rugulosus]